MLLDLKMPKVDGFEVLIWVRQQESLRALPIIVLTTSTNLADVNRAYSLGANSFFVKELDFQGSVNFSKLLESYWLKTAKTPLILRPQRKPNVKP
jgi:CheY-like chemotaxis protein